MVHVSVLMLLISFFLILQISFLVKLRPMLFQYPGILLNRAKESQIYFKFLGSLFPAPYVY